MSSHTNQEWLSALGGESGEAQSEVLQELFDYLLRAVLVYLSMRRDELADWSPGNVHGLAEDLAQDALLEIRHSLDTFKGDSKFTTWAYRFVINRAASELRRQRYRNVSLDQLQDEQPAVFQSMLAEMEEGAEIETIADRRRYLALLRKIIGEELSDNQRAAIIGVHWQGLSMDEAAAALGLTRNALYKLMHDARKRIKARLRAYHLTESDILAAFQS